MSFMESINLLPTTRKDELSRQRTILFFNNHDKLHYRRPETPIDPNWGVICFPDNFVGLPSAETFQIRVTNSANYEKWCGLEPGQYREQKNKCFLASAKAAGEIIGPYAADIVYQDSFTPMTIERFTGKEAGAIYGSPIKVKDGRTPYQNLFLAGTDQGFLGIVGAMLSGVSMVNQHLLQ
jgi:phytoene dehydrogenase-like protein